VHIVLRSSLFWATRRCRSGYAKKPPCGG
jgi:hypothetical protein